MEKGYILSVVGLRYELLLWRFWCWSEGKNCPGVLEASFDTGLGKLLPTWAGLLATAKQAVAKRLRYVRARIFRYLQRLEVEKEEEKGSEREDTNRAWAF